mmetsp:Transcript_3013/g.10539  ORF Transcript_3013/g.10539 Transcript_3013/m.10539 type:complete len:214 (-) Transcript_3013:8-649(-)
MANRPELNDLVICRTRQEPLVVRQRDALERDCSGVLSNGSDSSGEDVNRSKPPVSTTTENRILVDRQEAVEWHVQASRVRHVLAAAWDVGAEWNAVVGVSPSVPPEDEQRARGGADDDLLATLHHCNGEELVVLVVRHGIHLALAHIIHRQQAITTDSNESVLPRHAKEVCQEVRVLLERCNDALLLARVPDLQLAVVVARHQHVDVVRAHAS